MKIYWNNICLISRFEKQYIEQQLEKHQLTEYEFEYFGLGKETEMFERIIHDLKHDQLPDILISTDYTTFRHQAGLLGKEALFESYDVIEREEGFVNIVKSTYLFPILYIPLVFVVNESGVSKIPQSFKELITDETLKGQISFGGLANGAGKTLIDSVESLYGEAAADDLIANSIMTNMPIGAFQNVMNGQAKVAIVPTIFAMRQGQNNLIYVWPQEGAPVIPSFVAVKKGSDRRQVARLFEKVINAEFIQKISEQAGIIPCMRDTTTVSLFEKHQHALLYPDWEYNRMAK